MHALEQKVKMTYEDLAALGQEGLRAHLANPLGGDVDQAKENQESYKGAMKRYEKRCLAFIGPPDTKFHLLVWKGVGSTVMAIHYRFFKHCTWYSHSKEDVDRLGILEFCPGADGVFSENLATLALNDLSFMLFDPNGPRARKALGPLLAMFGACIHWPIQLLRVFQKATILAFCKIWRALRHRFLCSPWTVACIFDPTLRYDTRKSEATKYRNSPPCSVDPWVGEPLLNELCSNVEDLLDDDLQTFVWALFKRRMVTSTFVEKTFAPMTKFTSEPRSRVSLPLLQAQHCNTVFDESVQAWWETMVPEGQTKPKQAS